MSYIANVAVAAFLQITLSTDQQAAIDAIITGVEKAAESARNRTWNVTAQQVETFDGAPGSPAEITASRTFSGQWVGVLVVRGIASVDTIVAFADGVGASEPVILIFAGALPDVGAA